MGGVCGAQSAAAGAPVPAAEGKEHGREAAEGPSSKYALKKTARRRPSSIAYVFARRGSVSTLQSEIRRAWNALSHDESGQNGVACDLAQDGFHDYIAAGLVDARSSLDPKTAAEGMRALHLLYRNGAKAGTGVLFEHHQGLLPLAKAYFIEGKLPTLPAAIHLMLDAAGASAAVAQQLFEALGREGVLKVLALGRDCPSVEVMERAYAVVAAMARWPALRGPFVEAGVHAVAVDDLRNPMRQNRYRVSPARLLAYLALHVPTHPELEKAGGLRAAYQLASHPEPELVGLGLRALAGFMQTGRYRQRLARELPPIAAAACARGPEAAPLVPPALRAVRLAAMDTGELEAPDWIAAQAERDAEAEAAKLGPAGFSLRRDLSKLTGWLQAPGLLQLVNAAGGAGAGEEAAARLLAEPDRLYALVQVAGGAGLEAPPDPSFEEAAQCGGPWTPGEDATYLLATLTACEAGLSLVAASPAAVGFLQAAAAGGEAASPPAELRARARAALACLRQGRPMRFSEAEGLAGGEGEKGATPAPAQAEGGGDPAHEDALPAPRRSVRRASFSRGQIGSGTLSPTSAAGARAALAAAANATGDAADLTSPGGGGVSTRRLSFWDDKARANEVPPGSPPPSR
eukprot:tig00000178_g12787.t1